MLGIIIGVASVIAIVTIGNGGRDYIVGIIEDMGSNAIQIAVNVNVANQSQYITEEDISSIKKLSNVTYCTPYEFTFGQVQANDYNGYSITIAGNEDMLIGAKPAKHGISALIGRESFHLFPQAAPASLDDIMVHLEKQNSVSEAAGIPGDAFKEVYKC